MEPIGVQEFSFWIAGVVGHPVIDIDKMQVVGLPGDLFFDDLVGITDAVHDVPAGDAGFDGDEGKGDVAEALAGAGDQLLKKDKYFFRMTAVPQVVVSGVDDHRFRMKGGNETVKKPVARRQGRSAEAEVDGFPVSKVLVQAFPEPDGGTAVKKQFGFLG